MIVTKTDCRNGGECKIGHLYGDFVIEFLSDIKIVYEILAFLNQFEVANYEPEEAHKIWKAKEVQNEDWRAEKVWDENDFGDVIIIFLVVSRQPLVVPDDYVNFLIIVHFNLFHKCGLMQSWEPIKNTQYFQKIHQSIVLWFQAVKDSSERQQR